MRLYPHDDYNTTLDFLGNRKYVKGRYQDDVMVFRGMYGLDTYLIWKMPQNLPHYDFGRVRIDLRLYTKDSKKVPYFTDNFQIIDVTYDPKTSYYTLFAISEASAILQTMLLDYDVTSLNYIDNRNPENVLKDVLQKHGIFDVQFHRHPQQEEHRNFEYRNLTINYDWRVLDFINYIADQNEFEWFVRKNSLFIGKEIFAVEEMNSTKDLNKETDKESKSAFFKIVFGSTRPMDIQSHINKEWRCIWCKHWAGKNGGNSQGCFVRIGSGTIDKELYFRTLKGYTERILATRLLNAKTISHSVVLGTILKDSGNEKYIDEVSVLKKNEDVKINTPYDAKIARGTDAFNTKQKISRTTPYLDQESGLLFPSASLGDDIPPNSIIYNIEGKEESSVVGLFVMGNGNSLKIPHKQKEDFRLRFPDGAELFYDESAKMWLFTSRDSFVIRQNTNIPYNEVPTKNRGDDEAMFQIYQKNLFFDTDIAHMHIMEPGCFQVVPKGGPTPSDPNRRFALYCDNDKGEVIIESQNSIELKTYYGGALSNGTITLNTLGEITIGASATKVSIGGGTQQLAYKFHNHLAAPATDIFGLPLLGNVASNTQGTTKTWAG